MKLIIGLHGKLFSGKSTVEGFLRLIYEENVAFFSNAGALKKFCAYLTGDIAPYITQEGKNSEMPPQIENFSEKLEEGIRSFYQKETKLFSMDRAEMHKNVLDAFQNVFGDLADGSLQTKDVTYGKMLQLVGTEVFRNQINDAFWTTLVKKSILACPLPVVVLTDVRFPNEFEMVENMPNGHVIRIERQEIFSLNRDPNHPSETALDGVKMHTLENYGSLMDMSNAIDKIFVPNINEVGERIEKLPKRKSVHYKKIKKDS